MARQRLISSARLDEDGECTIENHVIIRSISGMKYTTSSKYTLGALSLRQPSLPSPGSYCLLVYLIC